jgi:tetratricopeptide (TPR) repeat protein
VSAIEAGRLDEAERILSAVVTAQPDSADANFYLGLARFRADRPAEARPLLERAVKLSPDNGAAWKTLGLVTLSGGDMEGALPALGKACELIPKDPEACYYFARDLHALGRYEAARDPFERALRASPKKMLPRVHRAAALNFAAMGLPQEAERNFLKAIQLNDRRTHDAEDPRVDYGAFLFRQGRTEEALHPLEQAARDAPSARVYVEWGRVLLHLDRLNDAVACLEKAVSLEPGNWNSHLLLGRAYLRLGKSSEGDREMRLGQEGWAGKK